MTGEPAALPVVTDVRVRALRIPTDAPEADGTASWDATTIVLVTVTAGEATGLGYTYTASAAARLIEEELAPVVRGRRLSDLPAIGEDLRRALRNAGLPGIGSCAVSALDVALWDARARALGLPLVELLGRVREAAPAYGSGGFTTYDDERLRSQLAGFAGLGCAAVKLKVGEARGTRVERDLERVAIAREAVGERVGLFVDANGAYGPGQARAVERELRRWRVSWFEEPVSSDDPRGLASVRRASRAEIAAGEYVYRAADAVALLSAGAVDCLQLDVTRCGGISGWQRIAAVAEAAGVPVSAHCAPQLAAHVGCATAGFRHLEHFHDHARIEGALFTGTLPVVEGALRPDAERAGHGLGLADAAEAAAALGVGSLDELASLETDHGTRSPGDRDPWT